MKGLRAENFTLLDNGVPQKLVSFHAVEGLSGPEDPLNPLAQVVLVLDAINLDDLQIAAAEHAIQKFLRQGDRRLAHPVSIYRLGPKGLSVSVRSSLDGDAFPDFFATHTTTRYQPRSEKGKKDKPTWKSAGVDGTVRLSSSSVEVIHYRDGAEVAEPVSTKREAQHKTQSDYEESLDTHGTFGPMLYTVIKDAAAGSLSWSRWEERSGGRMAIFRFVVPKNQSHYTVSFCCLTDMNNSGVLNWATGYHGELAINPENGGIMYLTVQADLEPRMPLLRAEIMVTYHEVDIGGRSYICPSHSVVLSRKRTVTEIHEWGDTLTTLSPFVTILNDATFTNYHKFGSESRMLPGFATVPNEH